MTRPPSNPLDSRQGSRSERSRSYTSNAYNDNLDTARTVDDRPSRTETSDDDAADRYDQNDRARGPATADKPPQQPLEVNFVLSPKAEPEEEDAIKASMIQAPPQANAAAENVVQSDQRSGGSSSSSSSSEDSGISDDSDVVAEDEEAWEQGAEDVEQSDPPPTDARQTSTIPSQEVTKESQDVPIAPAGSAAAIDPGVSDIANTAAALAATRASIEELSALVLQAIEPVPPSTAKTDDVLPSSTPDSGGASNNNSNESIEEAVGALQFLVAGIIAQGYNRSEDKPGVATGGPVPGGSADEVQEEPLVNARQRQPHQHVVPVEAHSDKAPAEPHYDKEEAWPARVAVRRSPQVRSGHDPASPTLFPSFDTVYGRCLALQDMAAVQHTAAFEKECAEYSTPMLLADEGNYNRCVVDSIETARYGELVLDWEAIHRCLLNANAVTPTRQQRPSLAESDSSSPGSSGSGMSSSVDDRNYQDSDDADERQAQATYLILGTNLMGSSDDPSEDVELSPAADEASSEQYSDQAAHEASSSDDNEELSASSMAAAAESSSQGGSTNDNEELSASSMAAAAESSSQGGSTNTNGLGRQQQWRLQESRARQPQWRQQQSPDDLAVATQERQPGSIIRVEIGPPESGTPGNQNMQNTQHSSDFVPQQTSLGGQQQQQQFSNVPQQYRPLPPPLRHSNDSAQRTARQPAFRAADAAPRPIEIDRRTQQLPSTAFLDSLDQSIGQLYCYDRNLQC